MAFFDKFRRNKDKDKDRELTEEQQAELEQTEEEGFGEEVYPPDAGDDAAGHDAGEEAGEEAAKVGEDPGHDLQPEEPETEPGEEEEPAARGKKPKLFERFKQSLTRTRDNIGSKIDNLVKRIRKVDEEFYEELEEILIQADVGFETSMELVERVKTRARKNKIVDSDDITVVIRDEIRAIMEQEDLELNLQPSGLTVIMIVGVNGSGKTTSIGKLAYKLKSENHKVMLAAADTFRAAAIDQLQIWADRVGVEIIKHQEGSDPAAVVYDAVHAARARNADVLLIDTAGRLQNKTNLMKELAKVWKVINRELPDAPHETLLVIDATTGQNAISQAKVFKEATNVSGIVLTKLDGTAKGGIVIAIASELALPVKLVGTGEKIDDLADFSAEVFASEILGNM